MIYPDPKDHDHRNLRRPLRRRFPVEVKVDDAQTRCILEVAAEHPKLTPAEVHAEIRHGQRRNDITSDMVRYVLAVHYPEDARRMYSPR